MSPKKDHARGENGFAILPLQAEKALEGRETQSSVGGVKALSKVRAEDVKRVSQNSFL